MSLATAALRCRPPIQTLGFLLTRQFHAGQPLLARKERKMPVLSKKQLAAKAKKRAAKAKKSIYDSEKMNLLDAINVLRAVEVASPNATYELVVKTALGKGFTIPKGRYSLPKEAKKVGGDKILVFAEGRAAEEARHAGADIVGGPELVDGVLNGRHQASMFLCTPDLIRAITPKLGRVLGPRGLMPSERRGTVTDDVGGYIRRLKGTIEWKGDKAGTIRAPIAKLDFPVPDVVKNVKYFMNLIKRATGNIRDPKAEREKGGGPRPVIPIMKVMLSSRQGPGIRISDV